MIDNLEEKDQHLITKISFELNIWKCNSCHKIFRTEQGCANHAIKCMKLKERNALEK